MVKLVEIILYLVYLVIKGMRLINSVKKIKGFYNSPPMGVDSALIRHSLSKMMK